MSLHWRKKTCYYGDNRPIAGYYSSVSNSSLIIFLCPFLHSSQALSAHPMTKNSLLLLLILPGRVKIENVIFGFCLFSFFYESDSERRTYPKIIGFLSVSFYLSLQTLKTSYLLAAHQLRKRKSFAFQNLSLSSGQHF